MARNLWQGLSMSRNLCVHSKKLVQGLSMVRNLWQGLSCMIGLGTLVGHGGRMVERWAFG